MRFMTMQEFLAWLTEYQVPLMVAVGVVTVLILAWLLRWTIQGHRVPAVIRVVGPLLGTAWNAEATYEVLVKALGMPAAVAAIGFTVFEMLMIGAAIEAQLHFNRRVKAGDPNPTLGPAKWFVFGIAFLTATAAAFNADSVVVVIFRYAVAIAVVWYWALRFMPDDVRGERKRTTWALHPRRVAVRIGLIDPTDADLSQVHQERQVRLMVGLARKIFHGSRLLRGWRKSRFAKLAELADASVMAEVVARITRAEMSLELADPATTEERLTALTRQADARRRALLTPDGPVSADVDAAVPGYLTPAALTPAGPVPDASVTRHSGLGRDDRWRQADASDAPGRGPVTAPGSANAHVNGQGGRQVGGTSYDGWAPIAPDVNRQAPLVKTVRLTRSTDASDVSRGRQDVPRQTSADAAQRLIEAEIIWRQSVSDGRPLTGRELGLRVGASESWGRTAIGNFRKRDQESAE